MQARLGRRRRIAESAVFRAALAERPRCRGGFFDVHCLPSGSAGGASDAPPSRLGLVVPRRVCRSAARRNWVKRMVRESFRRQLTPGPALDCVVRLRRAIPRDAVAAARSELIDHWRRVCA